MTPNLDGKQRRYLTSKQIDEHANFLINYAMKHHLSFRVNKKRGCTIEVLND